MADYLPDQSDPPPPGVVTGDRVLDLDSFLYFDYLKTIVRENGGIDLSRGDPLDLPASLGTSTYHFLSMFATRLVQETERQEATAIFDLEPDLVRCVWNNALTAATAVNPSLAPESNQVVAEVGGMVLDPKQLASTSSWAEDLVGAHYGDVRGQQQVRNLLAPHLCRSICAPCGLAVPKINGEHITLTIGANEAIGVLFGILHRHLPEDSRLGILEPAYSPYLNIMRDQLRAEVVALGTSRESGWEPSEHQWTTFQEQIRERPPRVFFIVNPSNPSGRVLSDTTICRLTDLLPNTLFIEDTVYHEFVEPGTFHSLWACAPKRSILVYSLSKYYRSSGSRLGVLVATQETDDFIRQLLGRSLTEILRSEKGPGPGGALAHTSHMPKPMQWLLLCRFLLDFANGRRFADVLRDRWYAFYRGLGVPLPDGAIGGVFAPYYCIVDLLELARCHLGPDATFVRLLEQSTVAARLAVADQSKLPLPITAYEVFSRLATAGVGVMPAARFYTSPVDHHWEFRASVANQPEERIVAAAQCIRDFLEQQEQILQG